MNAAPRRARLRVAPALFLATLALGCGAVASYDGPPPNVALVIERVTDWDWNASLVNEGGEPVVVVLPGDGSAAGWRTPVVRWTVIGEEGEVAQRNGVRCGNLNPLEVDEVVTLEPGASVSIARYGLPSPRLPASGPVEVSLTYENVPDLEWKGGTLGHHDSRALALLRRSPPLSLRSNVARFERAPEAE